MLLVGQKSTKNAVGPDRVDCGDNDLSVGLTNGYLIGRLRLHPVDPLELIRDEGKIEQAGVLSSKVSLETRRLLISILW